MPLATADTPGAFAFGLRLMAIDGTLEDVNETAANAQYFGRISEGQTRSPYPFTSRFFVKQPPEAHEP